MRHIVVDCEGSGEFLSLGEALRSGCITTGTVITMKGGMYKETIGLCIEHEHLTIRAENSKEKVVIKSYDGIRVEASHVTLSGLSVDLLSPKGYDGVEELDGHAIHVRAGTAVVLENCSANSATCAAIGIGDSVQSTEIEVTMVLCNARSSVGNAIICTGSRTKVQLQQCNGTHSKNGLEAQMGATADVRSSNVSCNEISGVLVWQQKRSSMGLRCSSCISVTIMGMAAHKMIWKQRQLLDQITSSRTIKVQEPCWRHGASSFIITRSLGINYMG